MKLYEGDCLDLMQNIKSGSVDLILTDPPYGTVKGAGLDGWKNQKTDWDNVLDYTKMWCQINRVLRKNGKCILFSQEPFTSNLIKSTIPNIPFSYRNIWLKDHFANSLIAKKSTVNYYEDICVFSKEHDLEMLHPLREYFKEVLKFIGLNLKQINSKLGHRKAEHSFYVESIQFDLCTENTYVELTDVFDLTNMENYKAFSELKEINSVFNSVFNLSEGAKYKSNVFQYKKDYEGLHPTQKPVALLEDLIKTYSNEDNLVLDFTMGSGSTGVACVNTSRNFIGIEKDPNYFKIASERINKLLVDDLW